MDMKHTFPPIGDVIDRLDMRAAAEDFGRKAAACEAIARACEELGIGADSFDDEAQRLRQRQRNTMAFVRGAR